MSFAPPPYPYERLEPIRAVAAASAGGALDCSVGTPIDEPPAFVAEELARARGVRGYPSSAGSLELRASARGWLQRRFDVAVGPDELAVCVGTKEFVASLAGYLRLRSGDRDTVLYPEISYPTYAMSATLAGLRAVAVPRRAGHLDLDAIAAEDARRALVLWANAPANPSGELEDFAAVARWGRAHGVVVASDECYADYTWDAAPASILQTGSDGVLAVHSVSKRSNLAGARVGFYAGDAELVSYLRLVRQHAGLMAAGPTQAAARRAYDDDEHVEIQRRRYRERLEILAGALGRVGIDAPLPAGGFYLWASRPGADGWELARELAERAGLVVSPGEFYGAAGANHVRIAVVQPTERLTAAARLLS